MIFGAAMLLGFVSVEVWLLTSKQTCGRGKSLAIFMIEN